MISSVNFSGKLLVRKEIAHLCGVRLNTPEAEEIDKTEAQEKIKKS
jgi:hypothetical protein